MSPEIDYIRGIGKDGDRLLILLDVDGLFGKEEIESLHSSHIA
jgi:chemotaxis signal transduction protein